ncbi:hypothetical protein T06_13769 [Trichinella sp. T6]|nr:hypothetical protein T06_13769 [Trichinella sp. T6]
METMKKQEKTAPAFIYRWCIHTYIVQPVVAFEHKP